LRFGLMSPAVIGAAIYRVRPMPKEGRGDKRNRDYCIKTQCLHVLRARALLTFWYEKGILVLYQVFDKGDKCGREN
jgi:hypothetical protein